MNQVRTLLTLLFLGTLANNVSASGMTTKADTGNPDEMVAYLFTYFNSSPKTSRSAMHLVMMAITSHR